MSYANTTNEPLTSELFQVATLRSDTFIIQSMPANQSRGRESTFSGKVNCSLSFNLLISSVLASTDGRACLAVGCEEGLWIGYRDDSQPLRHVSDPNLKKVTQCAMLEQFGIFLVLADKSLFAYSIESLVPASLQNVNTSHTLEKLNGTRVVQFFSVGSLAGRTLVLYMCKNGLDSVFYALDIIAGNNNDGGPLTSQLDLPEYRSRWFRVYRDFFLPAEVHNVIFLRARVAMICNEGFEIMDLSEFHSVTIPQLDDPRHEKLANRCRSCRPMVILRSSNDQFLLCYDKFGLYVDRSGNPDTTKDTVEWEGTAEHVAWHPPYVLFVVKTYDAPGMDADYWFHYPSLA